MPASLNEIKTKIASTKKTSQITGAMQMVSAAKLQKSEDSARNYQIYAKKVHDVTFDLLSHEDLTEDHVNPLLTQRPIKKTGYLVITSDRGLVGAYNTNIIKPVMADLQKKHDENNYESTILALGGSGIDFFHSHNIETDYELRGIDDDIKFQEVHDIVTNAIQLYLDEKFDELYVCYNHHVNSLVSSPRMEKMLPITIDEDEVKEQQKEQETNFTFELEPNLEDILQQLIPQYAESMIYGAIVDAKTAEHAAGMSAMKTATDNAKNVISDLTIQYNRARQAAITQEITEIVAGAAAI